jgi:hypothetical protein
MEQFNGMPLYVISPLENDGFWNATYSCFNESESRNELQGNWWKYPSVLK